MYRESGIERVANQCRGSVIQTSLKADTMVAPRLH